MEFKVFATIFVTIFLAELGDKTQLATMLFASDKDTSRMLVFAAASGALILTSVIGVAAGAVLSNYINEKLLSYIAGVLFVVIGCITLLRA